MRHKIYCHVCDKVDYMFHGREHFNWQEFATPEEIARADERRIGYINFVMDRVKKK